MTDRHDYIQAAKTMYENSPDRSAFLAGLADGIFAVYESGRTENLPEWIAVYRELLSRFRNGSDESEVEHGD